MARRSPVFQPSSSIRNLAEVQQAQARLHRKGHSMRHLAFASLLLVGLTAGVGGADAQASGRLSVPVSGLRNDDGVVRCGLYAGAEAFPKAGGESRGVMAKIKGGRATCVFNGLKPGTYAVAAFHAERNETQMQYGLFGKPKEGYGFSRNPSSNMGAPSFAAAAFDYAGGAETIPIRLTY
jgi:uncharacterized protein (DUF2141 family)